jgi:hypothetical protein
MPILLVLIAMVSMAWFAVAIPLILLLAVGATINYFVRINWDDERERRHGKISLAVVSVLVVIIAVVAVNEGWVAAAVVLFLIVCLASTLG